MRKILLVLVMASSVSGCAFLQGLDSSQRSILQGGVSFTAPAHLTLKQEYTVETVYNVAMRTYREYLRLPRCATAASQVCRDPQTVAALRRVRLAIVEPAMAKARKAQREGGVNAIEVLSDVRHAIMAWQASIPIGGR